ncbi:hypothetical protein EWM64_g2069 [Hericium alpestre]|uniref:glucan endo-1,3-beta-D-glucosidase n=1 Tax=Hericium alpestre TaxID=135208 RepID=A0A4Z0A4I2_9AGAM|nr:hypothetical protein EWM64_g2069 [Hericium alpestre]
MRRLYGADCNQSALVLEAIKQTKVDMQILAAVKTYGPGNIAGITVGNEFILNYLNANGASDPNSAVGNQGVQLLIADIQDTASAIQALNLSKHIPVGTADAGAYFNNEALTAVEYGMANVQPWFGNVSIAQAAEWTHEFFQERNVRPAVALANNPKMYVAEVGWPSASSDEGSESNGPSTASTANLQHLLDTSVCQSNTNGTGYFYFEFFDQTWKGIQFGGVEGYWGLFTADKELKNITVPSC